MRASIAERVLLLVIAVGSVGSAYLGFYRTDAPPR